MGDASWRISSFLIAKLVHLPNLLFLKKTKAFGLGFLFKKYLMENDRDLVAFKAIKVHQ